MVGFQLNLKKRAGGSKPGLVNKKPKTSTSTVSKSGALSFDDDSDEDTKVIIDSYDQGKGGAISGEKAVAATKSEPLVIVPANLSKKIASTKTIYAPNMEQDEAQADAMEEQEKRSVLKYGITKFEKTPTTKDIPDIPSTHNSPQQTKEEQIRSSLLNGEDINRSHGITISLKNKSGTSRTNDSDDSDEEESADYEKVPVDQFGAALLRGMGWKPPAKEVKSNKQLESRIDNRQKGILLGIGAKAVEGDLIEDIHGKKGTVLQAPLIKRERK